MARRFILTFLGICIYTAFSYNAAGRTVNNIDFDWYFHLGDVAGGESNDVVFKDWRLLDLPHEWSIEGEYRKDNPGGGSNAFLPGGIGWYKKEIDWEQTWNDKAVSIEFDGIFMNSTVWVNGQWAGYRPNGYIGIYYDITRLLKPGKNVISVKVDNEKQPASRWYSGSGIYRHVHLIVTDKIHVARQGVYVTTPKVSVSEATIAVEAEIWNESGNQTNVSVTSVVIDPSGQEVARSTQNKVALKDNTQTSESTVINDKLTIINPKRWNPDTPFLYHLITEISRDGKLQDTYTTRFGIRKTEFSIKEGFKLNDIPTKFKGVCLHQSMGGVGTAVPRDLWVSRLVQLKEMACNAVRTSHYPYAPEFYEICDSLGIMVLDEPFDGWFNWEKSGKAKFDYGYYFLDWWEKDLEDFIRRDRNHPSIMLWSLGNEVWGYDRHLYLQYAINKKFHTLDPTRPTTQAWALDLYPDIAGFNANGENQGDLERFHKAQPNKLAVGTEVPHTRSTRGVYRTRGAYNAWINPESFDGKEKLFPLTNYTEEEIFTAYDKRYASSYDNQTRRISVRDQWKQTRDNDFFIGEFRWTAFDYLGESWGWPARTNNYGIIDLAGFPKDNYYLYQSLWSDKPVVHLLPHWTHPDLEGVTIPVVVYTNGDSAELLFNGKSLGIKKADKDELQIVWNVPYKKGTITAIAYKDGKEIARKSATTASKPAAVHLTASRNVITANRRDVVSITADIVDATGNLVPYASNSVRYELSGPYKLLGVENGDILDISSNKSLESKAFMGKTLLIIQATGQAGTLKIKAVSAGLKSGTTQLTINKDE